MRHGRSHCALPAVVAIVSWPGLARPSTTLSPPAPPVVDGRHKPAHDTRGTPSRYLNAYAACAGHDKRTTNPPSTPPVGRRAQTGHRQCPHTRQETASPPLRLDRKLAPPLAGQDTNDVLGQ